MSRESQTIENTTITRGTDHILGMFVQVQDKRFAGHEKDPQGEGYVMDYDNTTGFKTNFINANALDIEDDERLIALTEKFIATLGKPFSSAQVEGETHEYLEPVEQTNSEFTPGPWVVDESHKHDREGIQIWANDVIVADVIPDQHNKHKANANLIAAAPDLLDALISIRRHGLIEQDGYETVVRQMNEAINKAKGI